jgi:hypothetical protein
MPKKQPGTLEQRWRTRHRRALDAAHKRLLASLSDPDDNISLYHEDLDWASTIYEEAMGIVLSGPDDDVSREYRWIDVFDRTFRLEIRKRGTSFVLCDVFDAAMRAAYLAVGQSWPDEPAVPKTAKQAPKLQRVA